MGPTVASTWDFLDLSRGTLVASRVLCWMVGQTVVTTLMQDPGKEVSLGEGPSECEMLWGIWAHSGTQK